MFKVQRSFKVLMEYRGTSFLRIRLRYSSDDIMDAGWAGQVADNRGRGGDFEHNAGILGRRQGDLSKGKDFTINVRENSRSSDLRYFYVCRHGWFCGRCGGDGLRGRPDQVNVKVVEAD